jgi:homoserine kinase
MRPGLALPIYLEVHVNINPQPSSDRPFNCFITYEGRDAEDVSLDPKTNLITRVALYVLGSHHHRAFPVETHIHIHNMIPLGRGLGSSAAAVTAGVVLANEVGGLGLGKARILDYCLMIGKAVRQKVVSYFG